MEGSTHGVFVLGTSTKLWDKVTVEKEECESVGGI